MRLLTAVILLLLCATACSGQKTDLISDMTGVWSFSDNSLVTISRDNDSVLLKTAKSEIRAKVGSIDTRSKTVNLKVVLPNGMDAVWSLQYVTTVDRKAFYLVLTLHDGKADVLQFVRRA
jgi:hypothetical protein